MKTGKISAFLLAVLLLISFCGCNSTDSGMPSSEPVQGNASAGAESAVSSAPEKKETAKKSLLGLLKTAAEPMGKTMYIWGGGWNEEDTGAGTDAVTLGVAPLWSEFAAKQTASYNYKDTRYQIHNGLDCSGYLGWVVYNTLETENGKAGYVMSSSKMAKAFADRGFGDYTAAESVKDHKPGDIMSMSGHVWISMGTCSDGSVVIMHASPPGVRLCGTPLKDGSESEAVRLARKYMSQCFPEWFAKYPDCTVTGPYLETSSAMRWNRATLSDDEHIADMTADAALKAVFD